MGFLERYQPVELAFLVALVAAGLLTPLVARVARAIGAVDHPDEERRIHRLPTPRLGGVAVLGGVLAGSLAFIQWDAEPGPATARVEQLVALLVGGVAATLLGALDDRWGLRWYVKLNGQVGVALLAVLLPLALPTTASIGDLGLVVERIDPPLVPPVELASWLGITLSVLWIVALMNMVNFIDGVDGLAAGTCAISAATFAIIAASYARTNVAVVSAATCGAAVGFLFHNFRRGGARIFLGDSGSMLLGYLLAVIAIQGVLKTAAAVALVIPLTLLAVPILDTTFVVAKRMKHRVPVSGADRWHLHHRLLNVGYSPRRVTISFWLWTAAMSLVAVALRFVDYGNSRDWNPQGLVVLALVFALALGMSLYLAMRLEIIKRRHVRERNRRLADARNGAESQEPQRLSRPMR